MEQETNQSVDTNVDVQNATKKGNSMKYDMIACAVFAVASIGFGVYEMLQANQAKPGFPPSPLLITAPV